MNKEETECLNYEEMYKNLEHNHRCQLEEIEHEFRNKLDSERNTKNIIIERQEKEIQFLKDIIKGILHKTMRVHKLVALAFIENKDNLPQINHKDGNKQNNCVDNLEWISNYDNIQHAIKNGLINQELRKENMRKVGKTGIGAKVRWS